MEAGNTDEKILNPPQKKQIWDSFKQFLNRPAKTSPAVPEKIPEIPPEPIQKVPTAEELDQFRDRISFLQYVSDDEYVTEEDVSMFRRIFENYDDPDCGREAGLLLFSMHDVFEEDRYFRDDEAEYHRKTIYRKILRGNTDLLAKIIKDEVKENKPQNRIATAVGIRYLALVDNYSTPAAKDLLQPFQNNAEKVFNLLATPFTNTFGEEVVLDEDAYLLLRVLLDGSQESGNQQPSSVSFAENKINETLSINGNATSEDIKKLECVLGKHERQPSSQYIRKQLESMTKELGMDFTSLWEAWRWSNIEELEPTELTAFRNLNTMRLMEQEKPGGIITLNRDWGIKSFARYSPEIWIDMLDSLDDKTKSWVFVLSAESDHNGALSHTNDHQLFDSGLTETWKHLKKKGFSIRIAEAGSETDVAEIVDRITKLEYIKADGFVIDSHGSEGQFGLGDEGDVGTITSGEILLGKFPIANVIKQGAPGVATMCFGGTAISRELTEVTKSLEVDAQVGEGAWQEIIPQFDNEGNLVGFLTKPTTPLVELTFDPKKKKVIEKKSSS